MQPSRDMRSDAPKTSDQQAIDAFTEHIHPIAGRYDDRHSWRGVGQSIAHPVEHWARARQDLGGDATLRQMVGDRMAGSFHGIGLLLGTKRPRAGNDSPV